MVMPVWPGTPSLRLLSSRAGPPQTPVGPAWHFRLMEAEDTVSQGEAPLSLRFPGVGLGQRGEDDALLARPTPAPSP